MHPRAFFRPVAHPDTGDMMEPSERFSWAIQRVIRRWGFVGTYTVVSWFWWWHNGAFRGGLVGWFHDPTLAHWNVVASLAALQIESAVGIVVIRQMVRDRKTLKAEFQELKDMHEAIANELTLLRAIAVKLGVDVDA